MSGFAPLSLVDYDFDIPENYWTWDQNKRGGYAMGLIAAKSAGRRKNPFTPGVPAFEGYMMGVNDGRKALDLAKQKSKARGK